MIKELGIKNFRSIRDQRVEIAPLSVFYGHNGSGKSSLINAIAIYRNIILNPNQPVDSFFNLMFANFGGFEQVVFEHDVRKNIEFEVDSYRNSTKIKYKLSFNKDSGSFSLRIDTPWELQMKTQVSFPYPLNRQESAKLKLDENELSVTWNGVLGQVTSGSQKTEDIEAAKGLAELINGPAEDLKECDFVNLMRGFSKPTYSAVPLNPMIYREDEVATILANDHYLQDKVSYYLEQITNHDFRIHVPLGTATFWLKTTDRSTGLSTELVNDGFGINQVVYLLAKSLRKTSSIICIEEPEIHLHPKVLRNLVRAFIRIINEEQKTFIVSTHSEAFVMAILSAVSTGDIQPNNVACYLCKKDRKESSFKRQRINEKGQAEGGLATFIEGELEDLKSILNID